MQVRLLINVVSGGIGVVWLCAFRQPRTRSYFGGSMVCRSFVPVNDWLTVIFPSLIATLLLRRCTVLSTPCCPFINSLIYRIIKLFIDHEAPSRDHRKGTERSKKQEERNRCGREACEARDGTGTSNLFSLIRIGNLTPTFGPPTLPYPVHPCPPPNIF